MSGSTLFREETVPLSDLFALQGGYYGHDDRYLNQPLDPGESISEQSYDRIKTLNLSRLAGKIIILEGPISIGKTTLGFSLEETLKSYGVKVKFIQEFVNPSLLNLYLSDRKKYSFLYQTIAQRERFHIHQQASKLAQEGYFVIIDRGVTGDLMFAIMQREEGFFTQDEWKIYWDTVLLHQESLFRPNLVIYLNCPAEVAFERLKRRGNTKEIEAYSVDYFQSLERACMKAREETDQSKYEVDLDWSHEDPEMYQTLDKDWRLSENYLGIFLEWVIQEIWRNR